MASTSPTARIEGHVYVEKPWLGILRVVWVVLLIVALSILGLSIPGLVAGPVPTNIEPVLAEVPPALARILLTLGNGLTVASSLLHLGLAALLFWRRGDHVVSLLLSYSFVAQSVLYDLAGQLDYLLPGIVEPLQVYGNILAGWTLPVAILLFPNGRFVPRWVRWVIPLGVIFGGLEIAAFLLPLPEWLSSAGILWLPIIVVFPVYRYLRVSTPTERQQTKWIIYGLVLWAATLAVLFFSYAFRAQDAQPTVVDLFLSLLWSVSTAFMPLAFTVALLRYQLWDIDVVIRRTFQYAAITVVLGLIYFGTVVLAQSALVALTGQRRQFAVVLSTLVIAALFNPVRRRLQQFVDRTFNRRSYNAEQTLARFGAAVQNEVDIADVEAALLRAVNETLQPTSVGLWVPEVER